MTRSTRAIVMRAFGGPEVLRAEELPLPGPRTVDAVLDSVVGALFEPLVAALADDGRCCMVGAMGEAA